MRHLCSIPRIERISQCHEFLTVISFIPKTFSALYTTLKRRGDFQTAIKRCSPDRTPDRTKGVASTARITRIIHAVQRNVHVYECTFYRRDSDKEDASLTRVCTICTARRVWESIFNEATPTRVRSCRRIIKLVPAREAYRPTERELTSLSWKHCCSLAKLIYYESREYFFQSNWPIR